MSVPVWPNYSNFQLKYGHHTKVNFTSFIF